MKETQKKRNEEEVLIRQFIAYCLRVLKNARTDFYRERKRLSKREILFSELSDGELSGLSAPAEEMLFETVFSVPGGSIGVSVPELADALHYLPEEERVIVLLYYFAGYTDAKIGKIIRRERSTVQHHRVLAVTCLKDILEKMEYRA